MSHLGQNSTIEFLSTPSARRATSAEAAKNRAWQISIHALREEGDKSPRSNQGVTKYFYPRPPRGGRPPCLFLSCVYVCISIHALREEGDKHQGKEHGIHRGFLSTPSARRATAKTETKSLFSNKLYNILHEFRRALIYNGSKSYPNHAK